MDGAVRVFRLSLRAFPREFQQRFADEMIEYFEQRRARVTSRPARIRFYVSTAIDLARALGRERLRARARSLFHFKPLLVQGDLASALRFLRRAPGLTLAIVLLMGSGIAASTGVFSIVNHVLLTPPPFHEPQALIALWEARPERGPGKYNVGAHEFPVWLARAKTLENAAAMTFTGGSASLTGEGEPASLFGVRVTASFFATLGAPPALGRGFVAEEDQPGRGNVVVISHRLWTERFAARRDVVGRRILLDDDPFEVVGVMPAAFAYPAGPPGVDVDIWRPIAEPFHLYRGRHYMLAIARMKPGLAASDVERELNVIAAAIEKELPEFNKGHRVTAVSLVEEMREASSATLLLLQAAVLGLLLIGCANVAGLLLASGIARRRELAVRMALGAARSRVARQLLAETLLLCAGGCVTGLAGAWVLTRIAPALVPLEILAVDGVRMNSAVVLFAVVVSAATGILIGLAPLMQVSSVSLIEALTSRSGDAHRLRFRRFLVAGQVALTLVLAAVAAVSLRTVASLQRTDAGFSVDGIVSSSVSLPGARYPDAVAHQQFYKALADRIAAQPGVDAVALANATPLDGGVTGIAVQVEGRPAPRPGEEVSVRYRVVSRDYFSTLGIPLRSGRAFADSDARRAVPLIRWFPRQPLPDGFELPQAQPVAVINEAMARALWPGQDPVGRRFTALLSPSITVAGVVGDTRDEWIASAPRPEFYLSNLQEPVSAMAILLRMKGDSDAAAPLRAAVWSIDSGLPIGAITPMREFLSNQIGLPRFTSLLMGAFAALALALMAAGVYALIAFSTRLRSRELGVRVALGASTGALVGGIVRQGLLMALAGSLAGAAAIAALAPVARQLPFSTGSIDATTMAIAVTAVMVVVAAASWIPARRAARVDPLVVLRHE